MQLRNTPDKYGWISIGVHWLMALVVFGMFGLGLYMSDLTYVDAWYKAAPKLHMGIGILLFSALLLRLFWRFINPRPQIYGQDFEKKMGLLVQRTHYVLLFVLMVAGYLTATADGRGIEVFSWFEVPAVLAAEKGREDIAGTVHMLLAWAVMVLVALHAGAALKHHFIEKDATLLRMLGKHKRSEI